MAKGKGGKKGDSSWFRRGKEAFEHSKKVDAEAKARRDQQGPRRFWLEPDSSAKFTWLDNPEFLVSEHNLKLNNRFHNFFTCIQEKETCPICESNDNPGWALVGTIISHKAFTDKDGNEHKAQKQLFVAKGRARSRIITQMERRKGDLTHSVYESTRGAGQTECSTGEDFEYLGKLNKEKLMELAESIGEDESWLEPFDYEEVFKPKSAAELRKIVGGKVPVGSEEEDASDASDPVQPEPEKVEDEVSIDDLL
jgi:hypothetical protein